jgi:hypothetical protein
MHQRTSYGGARIAEFLYAWIQAGIKLLPQKKYSKEGVCIFIKEDILYQAIHLRELCREKSFEMCVVKLQIISTKSIILCIYRAPSGSLNQFFNFWIVL